MPEPSWLIKARSYVGVAEDSDLPEILGWINEENGNTEREPWCADFVNHCLRAVGIRGSGHADAVSFVKWGKGVSDDKPIGAVVVFSFNTGHHVSFYAGSGQFLGGNQTREHEVIQESIPLKNAIAWRWPTFAKIPGVVYTE